MKKNPHAVALGRMGGEARARRLSKAERADSARKASEERWAKMSPDQRKQATEAARKARWQDR